MSEDKQEEGVGIPSGGIEIDINSLLGAMVPPPTPWQAPQWEEKLTGVGRYQLGGGDWAYVYDFHYYEGDEVEGAQVHILVHGDTDVRMDLHMPIRTCKNSGCKLKHGFTINPEDLIGLAAWAITKHLPYGEKRVDQLVKLIAMANVPMSIEAEGEERREADRLAPPPTNELDISQFEVTGEEEES